MLKKLSVAIAAATSVAFSSMAVSETVESPIGKFDVSVTATLASDYISRGYSLNGGGPTLQGSLDIAHESGLYVGVWGSGMEDENGDRGAYEFDYYIGYAGSLTDAISFDLMAAKYVYPSTNYDHDHEFLASLSAYGATVGIKYRTEDTEQLYKYVGYDLEVGAGFTLSAEVGHTDFDEEIRGEQENYLDWSLGVGKNLVGLDLALIYASNEDTQEDNILLKVSKTF